MRVLKSSFVAITTCLLLITAVFAQRQHSDRPTATGGPLMFEQAVFDVQSYTVDLNVTPATRSISGVTTMVGRTVIPTNTIVLDLDTPYRIEHVSDGNSALRHERKEGRLWIWFPQTKQVGDQIRTVVRYAGTPRVAPNPPWVGGFMWAKTPSGADWVSVALQNDGADLLFPAKDHPSDKPAAATMNISVPDPLVAVGPGKLRETKKLGNGYTTYTWHMSEPIANYSIVFDAAPYRLIEDSVKSITGETIPIKFYILPENFSKGAKLIEETKKYNAFLEKYLGPFPFRSQKLGIVETPHLGMEHSTHIAYGNKYQFAPDGFDWLMFHEFGHEWWANLVTASDWRDFWIHEGFQRFMDALYQQERGGQEAYFGTMKNYAKNARNMQPIAPREPKFSYQVYMAEPDYTKSDGDIYDKAAHVLHTLRYLIGDDAFFRALRRMTYPRKEIESWTGGRQTRLVTTDDFITIAEEESKRDLDWFFELYLRQPKLPRLVPGSVSGGAMRETLSLSWETPNDMAFPMPVEVVVDGKAQRVEMPGGRGSVRTSSSKYDIDPNGWVLMNR